MPNDIAVPSRSACVHWIFDPSISTVRINRTLDFSFLAAFLESGRERTPFEWHSRRQREPCVRACRRRPSARGVISAGPRSRRPATAVPVGIGTDGPRDTRVLVASGSRVARYTRFTAGQLTERLVVMQRYVVVLVRAARINFDSRATDKRSRYRRRAASNRGGPAVTRAGRKRRAPSWETFYAHPDYPVHGCHAYVVRVGLAHWTFANHRSPRRRRRVPRDPPSTRRRRLIYFIYLFIYINGRVS